MSRKFTTKDISLTTPCVLFDPDDPSKRISPPRSYWVALFNVAKGLDTKRLTDKDKDGNVIVSPSEQDLFFDRCIDAYTRKTGVTTYLPDALAKALTSVPKYDAIRKRDRKRSAWLNAVCAVYEANTINRAKPLASKDVLGILRTATKDDKVHSDLYDWATD